jgi:hypothetical protein
MELVKVQLVVLLLLQRQLLRLPLQQAVSRAMREAALLQAACSCRQGREV